MQGTGQLQGGLFQDKNKIFGRFYWKTLAWIRRVKKFSGKFEIFWQCLSKIGDDNYSTFSGQLSFTHDTSQTVFIRAVAPLKVSICPKSPPTLNTDITHKHSEIKKLFSISTLLSEMGMGLLTRTLPHWCKHQQWYRTAKWILQVLVPERTRQK